MMSRKSALAAMAMALAWPAWSASSHCAETLTQCSKPSDYVKQGKGSATILLHGSVVRVRVQATGISADRPFIVRIGGTVALSTGIGVPARTVDAVVLTRLERVVEVISARDVSWSISGVDGPQDSR